MRLRTAIILFVLAAIGLASFFDVYAETRHTCLVCRAIREQRWICGVPLQWTAQNDYSRSVQAKDSGHQHQWCYCGTRQSYSLVSMILACGRRHPIWSLPVDVQAQYARLVSPAELQDTLHAIDRADRKHEDEVVGHVYEKVLASR